MTRTYIVTVRVTGPDDRVTRRAAGEVAQHIEDQFRHDTLEIHAQEPEREVNDPRLDLAEPCSVPGCGGWC